MKLNAPSFLVVATTAIVIGLLLLLFFVEVPDAVANILSGIIGIILAKWQTIVDYYFGSSSGSKAKSDVINELTGTGDGSSKVTTNATITTEKVTTVTPTPVDPTKENNEPKN